MTTQQYYEFINGLLTNFASWLSRDLTQAICQTSLTTKQGRREKAFAYILDALTGNPDMPRFPSEQFVLDFLEVVLSARANAKSDEAKVSLDRTEKRLRWALEHQVYEILNKQFCHGCGEVITTGQSHQCTNPSSKMKDAVMSRDPDLL